MAVKSAGKAEAEGAGKVGGMSLGANLLAFGLAGLVAVGGGLAQAFLAARLPPPSPPEKADKSARPLDARIVDMGSIDLPPVVTNLAAPPDVWVRIEGTLLFEGKTLPQGEALAGQVSGDILAFMRTQTLQQIQGVAGLQHLRQDLNERVAIRSGGKVREFIIKSLVVQ